MAVVVSVAEENSYFSAGNLHRSPSANFASPESYSGYQQPKAYAKPHAVPVSPPSSPVSSAQTSPRGSRSDSIDSYNSTSVSSLSLDCSQPVEEDQIVFPSYDDVPFYGRVEDLEAPPSPRGTGDSYTVSSTSDDTSTNVSRPDSPQPIEHADDDTAIRTQPSRHVDYLSHAWREEDIWSSWKLIVSKRGAYSNSARLENASWRTWAKSMHQLKTVSPETLNWLKDCDVTWLYGPLQTGADADLNATHSPEHSDCHISKTNSFLQKKPILKKRSMSELMLQRSISTSSLVKQAAAAVQAQQSDNRPPSGRLPSDYISFSYPSRHSSRDTNSLEPSLESSGLASPSFGDKKHIHFNEQVEQCIALDMKGEDEDEAHSFAIDDFDSEDSDEGGIMMKRSDSGRILPHVGGSKQTTPRASFSADGKTIAMLPSTTLKYREDTPEPNETAMKHSTDHYSSNKLSPSASQETLRPSKPSTCVLLSDEDEDDELDWESTPHSFLNRKDSMSVSRDQYAGLNRTNSSSSLTAEPTGMRRTPSGMFMPYEEDEDDIVSEGLFGKVVDTVNTAKDIAHVIWNDPRTYNPRSIQESTAYFLQPHAGRGMSSPSLDRSGSLSDINDAAALATPKWFCI